MIEPKLLLVSNTLHDAYAHQIKHHLRGREELHDRPFTS